MKLRRKRGRSQQKERNTKDVATWVGASQPPTRAPREPPRVLHVQLPPSEPSESTFSSQSTLVEKPVALDGGYGWVIVIWSFLMHSVADGMTFTYGIIFSSIIDNFDSNRFVASIIGSIFLGSPLLLSPFAATITDNYGCRKTIQLGSVTCFFGCCVAILGYYIVNIVTFGVGFGLLMGIGLALIYNAAIVIVTLYFDKRIACATSLAVSGTGVGTIALPSLLFKLSHLTGIDRVMIYFIVGPFIFALIFVATLFWIKDPKWTSDTVEYKKKMFERRVRQLDVESAYQEDIEIPETRRCNSLPTGICFDNMTDFGGSIQSLKEAASKREAPPRSRSVAHFTRSALPAIPEYTMITQEELGHLEHLDLQMSNSPAATIIGKPRIRMLSKTSMSVDAINDMDDDLPIKITFSSESDESSGSEESDSEVSNDGETSDSELSDRCLNKVVKQNGTLLPSDKTPLVRSAPTGPTRAVRPSLIPGHNAVAPGRILAGNATGYRMRPVSNLLAIQGRMSSAPLLPQERRKWYMKNSALKTTVFVMKQFVNEIPVYQKLLKHPAFFSFTISVIALYAVLDVPYIFFNDHAIVSLGVNEENSKHLTTLIGAFNLISTWTVGSLSDVSVLKRNRFRVYGVGMFAVSLTMLGTTFAVDFAQMAVASASFGFFISSNYVLQSVLLTQLFPDMSDFSSAYALCSFCEGLATFVGPPIIGYIRDHTGSYRPVFLFTAVLVFISAVLSFRIQGQIDEDGKPYKKTSRDSVSNDSRM